MRACAKKGDYCSYMGRCGTTHSHTFSHSCDGPSPGSADLIEYICTKPPRSDQRCGPQFGNATCAQLGQYCSANGWCGHGVGYMINDVCGGPAPNYHNF